MVFAFLRWLGRNVGTLLLAFILAVVVWVSAVTAADPNEVRIFRPVPLERVGTDPGMLLTGDIPENVRLTISAPRSKWSQLENNSGLVRAWIDLTGLGPGEHTVPVQVDIRLSPVRYELDQSTVDVNLEPVVTRKLPVELVVDGDPPLGYKRGAPASNPSEVTVSGPESNVMEVAHVRAAINISGARETKTIPVPVEAVDENGFVVTGVTITPKEVTITQPLSLEGGFKNVVVKVDTVGQVANGYRLTTISVTPPNITVFSGNPELVDEIPGYLETKPLDLTDLNDDVEIRVEIELPSGVSLVGEQSVLVQVGIAAIEGSLTISLPVETLGLAPELAAQISPSTVDVIVSGPLPVLDTLTTASFRVVVDVTGLLQGTYPLRVVMDLIPDEIEVESLIPETVEVIIIDAPTPTPSPTPFPTLNPLESTPPATVQP